MARPVQFVTPSANDVRLVPEKPEPLGLHRHLEASKAPLDDEDDPELVETLSALFWFSKREALEDE